MAGRGRGVSTRWVGGADNERLEKEVTMRSSTMMVGVLVAAVAVTSCKQDELTLAEAQEALDAAVASGEGEAATTEIIEISTSFTIGAAVQQAADELRGFLASQIPCSTVTLDNATVTVDFGSLGDACTFNGHTYAGIVQISIARNDMGNVEVNHAWKDLTNGKVTLNGDAKVTWSTAEGTRRVEHHAVWNSGSTTVDASGDRTMSLVDPSAGLAGGVQIDGTRSWTLASGDWDLQIDGVQMRGQDPVPQAGTYTLTTPKDKVLTLNFERIDASTIQVTFTGTRNEHVIKVKSTGK